jgi:hypothetical protein
LSLLALNDPDRLIVCGHIAGLDRLNPIDGQRSQTLSELTVLLPIASRYDSQAKQQVGPKGWQMHVTLVVWRGTALLEE